MVFKSRKMSHSPSKLVKVAESKLQREKFEKRSKTDRRSDSQFKYKIFKCSCWESL